MKWYILGTGILVFNLLVHHSNRLTSMVHPSVREQYSLSLPLFLRKLCRDLSQIPFIGSPWTIVKEFLYYLDNKVANIQLSRNSDGWSLLLRFLGKHWSDINLSQIWLTRSLWTHVRCMHIAIWWMVIRQLSWNEISYVSALGIYSSAISICVWFINNILIYTAILDFDTSSEGTEEVFFKFKI